MYNKDDFLKALYSTLPSTVSDPEAVEECINIIYDAFDKMSYMLNMIDQDIMEGVVAKIICFHLPTENADGIAEEIKENIRK